jgi:hypothetical protein
MNPSRRDFLKTVGIGIASFALSQCTPFDGGIDPTEPPDQSPLARLRRNWLDLANLATETREDYERGQKYMSQLTKDHRATLNELVSREALDANVADQIQVAFSEAAYHMWRSNAPITCYEPMIVDYTPTSRGQLIQQTGLLVELAESGTLNKDAIAQAQAALERDIAFLNLTDDETQSLYQELMDAAGQSYQFPSFDEIDLDIPSTAIEGAKFLVEVLFEDG